MNGAVHDAVAVFGITLGAKDNILSLFRTLCRPFHGRGNIAQRSRSLFDICGLLLRAPG